MFSVPDNHLPRRAACDRSRPVIGTSRQLETILHGLQRQILTIERTAANAACGAALAPVLKDMRAKQRALMLLLINRKLEAMKPVVDFQKWRDGHGALYLCWGGGASENHCRTERQ
jgi:hypothetical protein